VNDIIHASVVGPGIGSSRLSHEIAGFGDDVLQDIENLAHAGFLVNEFGY